jgi:hypothetical protein
VILLYKKAITKGVVLVKRAWSRCYPEGLWNIAVVLWLLLCWLSRSAPFEEIHPPGRLTEVSGLGSETET